MCLRVLSDLVDLLILFFVKVKLKMWYILGFLYRKLAPISNYLAILLYRL